MEKRKLLNVAFFILVGFGILILARFISITSLFACTRYYTSVTYHDIQVPDKYEFAHHFEQDKWEIFLDHASSSGSKEIVRAKKKFHASYRRGIAEVRLNSFTEHPQSGSVEIMISNGTKSINKKFFEDLIQSLNSRFNLDLNPGKFNYIRTCY